WCCFGSPGRCVPWPEGSRHAVCCRRLDAGHEHFGESPGMATPVGDGRSWVHRLVIAACMLISQAMAFGAQLPTAGLEGTVQDASGAVIIGAAVTLRDPQTNRTRTTQTDSFGTFRFSDVPVGTYDVRVESDGFARYAHAGLTLALGQTARMVAVLQPTGVVEEVAVTAHPPPLDSRQTSVATVIDTERIEELPVRSRNYLEFVLLAPGVTRASPQPVAGALTSIFPSSGFSFGGLRPRSNTLTIDGIDNTDEFTGSGRTELSLEVVREFQVVTSGW